MVGIIGQPVRDCEKIYLHTSRRQFLTGLRKLILKRFGPGTQARCFKHRLVALRRQFLHAHTKIGQYPDHISGHSSVNLYKINTNFPIYQKNHQFIPFIRDDCLSIFRSFSREDFTEMLKLKLL